MAELANFKGAVVIVVFGVIIELVITVVPFDASAFDEEELLLVEDCLLEKAEL